MTKIGNFSSAGERQRPPSPLDNASIYSKLFFNWVYPLMKTGLSRPIEEIDLPDISAADSSARNRFQLESIWRKEVERAASKTADEYERRGQFENHRLIKPSLKRVLLMNYIRTTWLTQLKLVLSMASNVGQAVALGFLIEEFGKDKNSDDSNPFFYSYIYATILVVCGIIYLFTVHGIFFELWRKGMQLKIASVAIIHSKSLNLSSIIGDEDSKYSISSGKVMNLIHNDVERISMASVWISFLFWGPVQSIAILYVGLRTVGPAFAAGFGLMVFTFLPMQYYLSKRFAFLRSRISEITDKRVTLVSQAVSGVRVVKMNGWEDQFQDRINKIRKVEINSISRANRLKAWNKALFFISKVALLIVIFVVHVLMGGVLSPKIVFTTVSLTSIVLDTMVRFFAMGMTTVSECGVSIDRIQKFFELPELHNSSKRNRKFSLLLPMMRDRRPTEGFDTISLSSTIAVSLSNVTCYWNHHDVNSTQSLPPPVVKKKNNYMQLGVPESRRSSITDRMDSEHYLDDEENPFSEVERCPPALSNINLNIYTNELCCIIGAVGSGKSALIQAIAGELPPQTGKIKIMMGSSGTSEMRKAYAPQDPWMMDGSVRDNITMGRPFDEQWYREVVLACGLATDFLQFVNGDLTIVGDRGVQCSGGQRARIGLARAFYQNADVIILDDPLSAVDATVGRVVFDSAIQGLGVKRGKCVVLATHQHQFVDGDSTKCVLMDAGKIICMGSYDSCVEASNGSLIKMNQANVAMDYDDYSYQSEMEYEQNLEEAKKIVLGPVFKDEYSKSKSDEKKDSDDHEEETKVGSVSWRTLHDYGRAMGSIWIGISMLVLFVVTQALEILFIALVGDWSEQPAQDQRKESTTLIIMIINLGVVVIFLSTARALLTFSFALKASRRLHDRMTNSVIRAKIEFFDTNPLGRVLNRFSADIGSNDDMLPLIMYDFLICMLMMAGGMVTAISVLPVSLIALPPLLWYIVRLRRIFVTTSRELKRLEGKARSPIFALMNESLSGIATIRSNGASEYYKHKFQVAHDAHTRAVFAYLSSSRWLGFRIDSIVFALLSVSTFLAVVFQHQGWMNIDPAVLGLALTLLLQLAENVQWGVRQSAEVVNQMVSVERVLQYGNLQPEAPLVVRDKDERVRKDFWPMEGSISISNLSVRYRENLPTSLDGVTFDIPKGERVGVVGRTGSGKSTLIQALFRLLEAEEGQISIDGVDISELGLHKLRTIMSVIPQTPVLFSGCTLRENLDPFNHFSDNMIRNALLDVQMLDVVKGLKDGIDSTVSEAGSNFSVGQRQLLCLARAILRKNPILVLDEATANVDSKTEELMQHAVLKSFDGATTIAVAHRLDTVIDFDKILVLGKGKVLEYGSPRDLLLKRNGVFASMVEDTGDQMAETLHRKAGVIY